MTPKTSLGRGLGALIQPKKTFTEQALPQVHASILQIDPLLLKENPRQPREHFSAVDMEDLIGSIKEHGILQPLIVTKTLDGYELIAGERRLRAARSLGLKTVPAIVRQADEQQKLELALIENIQRADLNPAEEAIGYKALLEEFHLSLEALARRVGKSPSAVSNMMRLTDLPSAMFTALREGKLTKSHARTLLSERDPQKQQALFEAILSGKMTVREMEARTSGLQKARKTRALQDPNMLAHEKRLREMLGTKVLIREERGGRGHIRIEYYSKEELSELLNRLSD